MTKVKTLATICLVLAIGLVSLPVPSQARQLGPNPESQAMLYPGPDPCAPTAYSTEPCGPEFGAAAPLLVGSGSPTETIQVVHLIPSGQTPVDRSGPLLATMASVNAFLTTDVGRTLQHMGVMQVSVAASPTASYETLVAALEAAEPQLAEDGRINLVFVEGPGDGQACGRSQLGTTPGAFALVYLDSCGFPAPSNVQWPFGITYITLHELLHALGAVASCSPNQSGDGHATDSNKDVIGTFPRDWDNLTVDFNRDDYYDHSNTSCVDIADSPFWVTANASVLCLGQIVTVNIAAGQVPTEGADVILGTTGPDTINAKGGNDLVCGRGGTDVILGGNGNDTIVGPDDTQAAAGALLPGQWQFYGGIGNDTIDGTFSSVGLVASGGDGDDTIYGSQFDDQLFGSNGDDGLHGGNGDDIVSGGAGSDWLDFSYTDSSGATVVSSNGSDTLLGGDDTDYALGGLGNDLLSMGEGDDFGWGGAGTDQVFGGDGVDQLTGNENHDVISGGAGADALWGDAGNDEIYGKEDTDQIYGGPGNDVISGGGNTEACSPVDDVFEIIVAGDGNDTIFGGDGNDQISGGAGIDTISGGDCRDTMWGGTGPDVFYGGAGNDYLNGESGADEIYAGDGADYLLGGTGFDPVIHGQNGTDLCDTGGTGPSDPLNGGTVFSCENGAQSNNLVVAGTSLSSPVAPPSPPPIRE